MEAFYEPIHEDDTKETWEELEQAVEDTGKLKTEYRIKGAIGDIIWVEVRGEVEYNNNDEPNRMHSAIADITERKTREQRVNDLRRGGPRLLLVRSAVL
ncbi:PAS domain-containing protein [Natronococcus wangiae]|uniref:PAS domain-containing protein n=1 Tax=Natronococcus wangiae TaxID=3068275 RepID=UPI00273D0C8D|nr:PAS domain-containing protein [Natronococcus sp. AD5]